MGIRRPGFGGRFGCSLPYEPESTKSPLHLSFFVLVSCAACWKALGDQLFVRWTQSLGGRGWGEEARLGWGAWGLGPQGQRAPGQEQASAVGWAVGFGWGSAGVLTTRVPPQDELPDLIVEEDEEAVGEGAEPPSDPGRQCQEHRRLVASDQSLDPRGAFWRDSLERVHAEGHPHARAVGQKGGQSGLLQEPKNQNLVPRKVKKGG